MGEKAVMILVTMGARDDAERLGELLVVEHLAASCSVIPTVHSFYYADGQLQREHEGAAHRRLRQVGRACGLRRRAGGREGEHDLEIADLELGEQLSDACHA